MISTVLDVTGELEAFEFDTTTFDVREVSELIVLAVILKTLLLDPDIVRFAPP